MFKRRFLTTGLALVLLGASTMAVAEPATWREPHSGATFVQVPAGCFAMGANHVGGVSHDGQPRPPGADESPRHEVCVDGFWLGRHEVTRGEWRKVTGDAPPGRGAETHPVTHLAPEDAQRFVDKLNALSDAERFRLPTEAEWEYACRAGADEVYPDDNTPELVSTLTAVAWYRVPMRDDPQAAPVGERRPNAWGLHDMLGNAAEWVDDTYHPQAYAQHRKMNPRYSASAERYVLRGGSYKSDWWNLRCGARSYGLAGDRLPTAGLRLVRASSPQR